MSFHVHDGNRNDDQHPYLTSYPGHAQTPSDRPPPGPTSLSPPSDFDPLEPDQIRALGASVRTIRSKTNPYFSNHIDTPGSPFLRSRTSTYSRQDSGDTGSAYFIDRSVGPTPKMSTTASLLPSSHFPGRRTSRFRNLFVLSSITALITLLLFSLTNTQSFKKFRQPTARTDGIPTTPPPHDPNHNPLTLAPQPGNFKPFENEADPNPAIAPLPGIPNPKKVKGDPNPLGFEEAEWPDEYPERTRWGEEREGRGVPSDGSGLLKRAKDVGPGEEAGDWKGHPWDGRGREEIVRRWLGDERWGAVEGLRWDDIEYLEAGIEPPSSSSSSSPPESQGNGEGPYYLPNGKTVPSSTLLKVLGFPPPSPGLNPPPTYDFPPTLDSEQELALDYAAGLGQGVKRATKVRFEEMYNATWWSAGPVPNEFLRGLKDEGNVEGKGKPKVQWEGFVDGRVWETEDERRRRNRRRMWVKRSFLHAWEGYKKHAWGHDEHGPISNEPKDPFNGWGATVIDSLDTLLLMNLTSEYDLCRPHIRQLDFTLLMGTRSAYSPASLLFPTIPVFETVIRYLGGLLGAYDIGGQKDAMMLKRARELADWILPSFGTRSGLPLMRYQIGSNPGGNPTGSSILSEVASETLEFMRLWQITGDEKYYHVVQRVTDLLDTGFESKTRLGRLLPQYINGDQSELVQGTYSMGAREDSYYEYLIKTHHLLSGATTQYSRMYSEAMDSAHEHLIRDVEVVPGERGLLTIGTSSYGTFVPTLDHLACFGGAMLGLGGKLLERERDLDAAQRFTKTCHWAYRSTATGVGAESMTFFATDDVDRYNKIRSNDGKTKVLQKGEPAGVRKGDFRCSGRPEVIESVFYMWRITGDKVWQDRGWQMFVDWVEQSITETGFANLVHVNFSPAHKEDSMESYILAETFKYYYLLFSDPDVLSLDEWVFNTEAHPFRLPTAPPRLPTDHGVWQGLHVDYNIEKLYGDRTDQEMLQDSSAMRREVTDLADDEWYLPMGSGTIIQQWYKHDKAIRAMKIKADIKKEKEKPIPDEVGLKRPPPVDGEGADGAGTEAIRQGSGKGKGVKRPPSVPQAVVPQQGPVKGGGGGRGMGGGFPPGHH